ncbi:hypothetical protein VPHD269_0071 [Vibrio phage D269]
MSKIDRLLQAHIMRSNVCNYVNTTYVDDVPPEELTRLLEVNKALNCFDCATCPSHSPFKELKEILDVKNEPIH